jgi:hypothetical protein
VSEGGVSDSFAGRGGAEPQVLSETFSPHRGREGEAPSGLCPWRGQSPSSEDPRESKVTPWSEARWKRTSVSEGAVSDSFAGRGGAEPQVLSETFSPHRGREGEAPSGLCPWRGQSPSSEDPRESKVTPWSEARWKRTSVSEGGISDGFAVRGGAEPL